MTLFNGVYITVIYKTIYVYTNKVNISGINVTMKLCLPTKNTLSETKIANIVNQIT